MIFQLFLRDFGNLGALRLNPPAPLREILLVALDSKEAGWTEADGKKVPHLQTQFHISLKRFKFIFLLLF